MARKKCADGQHWDNLLNTCIVSNKETRPEPEPLTEPPKVVLSRVRDMAPTDQTNPVMPMSPTVCAIVVLVTMGSILALAVWLIIYRRQTRLTSTSVDSEPVNEPLQKTEPPATIFPPPAQTNGQAEMFHFEAGAPSPCPYLGAQTGSKLEEGFTACRGLTKHTEGRRGLMSEHRIPLPATELGGTALVTTKTV